MYNDKKIQKLIDELDIVEVIGEYVVLKKVGSNYKGLSPFKEEKTPSFSVSPQKKIFKDFSTGLGGDVITFYMKINNISFNEAIKELSSKYNINIGNLGSIKAKESINSKYYKIMTEAQRYFANNIFDSKEAIEYMKNRGYSEEEIKKFGIGYASDGWNGLYDHMAEKGYAREDLLEVGLVKENDKGNTYDYFRNRIIFPIYNANMKIIGFGGRIIGNDNDVAKYLNSPDSKIFKKGQELFGLYNRGESIREKDYAILMEGYLDVLTAQKYDFKSSVASLGTAFTEKQAKLLRKYTENVIIAYDSDSAGRDATVKAAIILKKNNFNIRCLGLEGECKDPDEYLRKYGRQYFLEELKKSKDIFEYLFDIYSEDLDLDNYIGKIKLLNRLKEFMESVRSDIEKAKYLQTLYEKFPEYKKEIEKMYVKFSNSRNYRAGNKNKAKKVEQEEKQNHNITLMKIRYNLERDTLIYLLKYADKNKEIYKKHISKLRKFNSNNEFFNKLSEIDYCFGRMEELNLNETEKKIFILRKIDAELSEHSEEDIYKDLFIRWYLLELEEVLLKNQLNIKLINLKNSLKGRAFAKENFDSIEKIEESYKKFKDEQHSF